MTIYIHRRDILIRSSLHWFYWHIPPVFTNLWIMTKYLSWKLQRAYCTHNCVEVVLSGSSGLTTLTSRCGNEPARGHRRRRHPRHRRRRRIDARDTADRFDPSGTTHLLRTTHLRRSILPGVCYNSDVLSCRCPRKLITFSILPWHLFPLLLLFVR